MAAAVPGYLPTIRLGGAWAEGEGSLVARREESAERRGYRMSLAWAVIAAWCWSWW